MNHPGPVRVESIEPIKVCDGVIDCSLDNSDEHDCSNRLYCTARNAVSIPIQKLCDGFKDCDYGGDYDYGEDERNCPNRFYCKALGGTKVLMFKSFADIYQSVVIKVCKLQVLEINCKNIDCISQKKI